MTHVQPDAFLRQALSVLDVLAFDAEQQVHHVRCLGVGVDEMALEFDDVFRQGVGMEAEGLIAREVMSCMIPVDEILQRMTEATTPLWTEKAVRASVEWAELRTAAERAAAGVRRVLPIQDD
ncbi:hypothetical protein ACH4PU_06510 [Streptomyces sp. NPDC021100]|uniref:hypothetical protein n=1 Tax=Streptomyces sp. NPDC021100 TaxID=3365114 RepID=UPI00378EF26F